MNRDETLQLIGGYTGGTVVTGTTGTTLTLDLSLANVFAYTLTGNVTTFSITNAQPTGKLSQVSLFLKQDAVGTRTVTWPGAINWGDSGTPILSTTINKEDKLLFETRNSGSTFYGLFIAGGF